MICSICLENLKDNNCVILNCEHIYHKICIKEWLKKYTVQTVGRFAEWDYINSDEALKRGLDIGNQISKK